ncbi:MAG TPA: 50S ribosomal protein L2 [Candidatus Omnitrophota bacterium]|nr:50S ribosomal protein L2 [Candidatus Omnitrophota bacterium]
MGKTIIQQARGHGSLRYRVRRQAFRYRLSYPSQLEGEGTVLKLINSLAHSAPIARIKYSNGIFYMPAFKGMIEGQKINFGGNEIKDGNILKISNIPVKTFIYCIEARPGDGGIFIKTGGTCGTVSRIIGEKIFVAMPSKKEKEFNPNCRAVVGVIAGAGRLDKPIIKAGKQHYIKKAKGGRVWPRTSAVKFNAVDHPFGSGRGKRPKSKIAKRNAPPGKKVGTLRPRRTGRRR